MSAEASGGRAVRVAVALGGGGARGFAHIAVLEALDAAGVRPVAIAGASIGAVVGAAYAAGIPPAALRQHVLHAFRDRAEVMSRLFRARVGTLGDLLRRAGNPVLLDGGILLDQFWPPGMPLRIEDLAIPFTAVAADFHSLQKVEFRQGPLRSAVAASMALPGLVQPVRVGGRVLIDGGALDPLPVQSVLGAADVVIAVDISSGVSRPLETKLPGPWEAAFGAFQLMQSALVMNSLAGGGERVRVIRPAVQRFNVLDFHAAKKIFAAAESVRADVESVLATL